MARIAGEFIINQVEKEIIGIYNEMQEQEAEKIRKLKEEEEEAERMREAELEIQRIKEEQKKVEEQIKNNDTLDNIGSQIQIEIATLEEIKKQGYVSSSSSKKRRSKKERSQSPNKNILKFGDSFKISEKQDQDFET